MSVINKKFKILENNTFWVTIVEILTVFYNKLNSRLRFDFFNIKKLSIWSNEVAYLIRKKNKAGGNDEV